MFVVGTTIGNRCSCVIEAMKLFEIESEVSVKL
jgi:hypothetical protein